jgi:hypothetical protein
LWTGALSTSIQEDLNKDPEGELFS